MKAFKDQLDAAFQNRPKNVLIGANTINEMVEVLDYTEEYILCASPNDSNITVVLRTSAIESLVIQQVYE